LADAQQKIMHLEKENQTLRIKIAELEAEMRYLHTRAVAIPDTVGRSATSLMPALLAIFGPESKISVRVEQSLRRALDGNYTRLENADEHEIQSELQRRRVDDNLYPWVCIAAHGTAAGIMLETGLQPSEFWQEQLTGVDTVMLLSCESAKVADMLAGVVRVTVYFLETAGVEEASQFCEVFWRAMDSGRTAEQAFVEARKAVPQISSYVGIRVPKRK